MEMFAGIFIREKLIVVAQTRIVINEIPWREWRGDNRITPIVLIN